MPLSSTVEVRHIPALADFLALLRGRPLRTGDRKTPLGFQFVPYIERLKQKLATARARDVDIVVLPARRPELRETLSREAIAAF